LSENMSKIQGRVERNKKIKSKEGSQLEIKVWELYDIDNTESHMTE